MAGISSLIYEYNTHNIYTKPQSNYCASCIHLTINIWQQVCLKSLEAILLVLFLGYDWRKYLA